MWAHDPLTRPNAERASDRLQEILGRLGGWHHEKGTRQGDQLSLTDIVRKCPSSDHAEGSNHPALPTFSAPSPLPSTHWPSRPNPGNFDPHTGSPPSNSGRSTPSGPRCFEGSLSPGRVSEFKQDPYIVRGVGSPGAANAMCMSSAPIKNSDLHCEMDNLWWTTIATTPYVAWYDNYTLTGCGAVGCEACDRPQSEPGFFHPSVHALNCSMMTRWEAGLGLTPLYHNRE